MVFPKTSQVRYERKAEIGALLQKVTIETNAIQ